MRLPECGLADLFVSASCQPAPELSAGRPLHGSVVHQPNSPKDRSAKRTSQGCDCLAVDVELPLRRAALRQAGAPRSAAPLKVDGHELGV